MVVLMEAMAETTTATRPWNRACGNGGRRWRRHRRWFANGGNGGNGDANNGFCGGNAGNGGFARGPGDPRLTEEMVN